MKRLLMLMLVAVAMVAGGCIPSASPKKDDWLKKMEDSVEPGGYRKSIKKDEFNDSVTYEYFRGTDILYPKFNPMVIEKKGEKSFNVVLNFHGLSWIYIQQVYMKINDAEPVAIPSIEIDHSVLMRNFIIETHLAELDLNTLQKIVEADKVVFRAVGKGRQSEITLDNVDRAGLAWLLEVYEGNNK